VRVLANQSARHRKRHVKVREQGGREGILESMAVSMMRPCELYVEQRLRALSFVIESKRCLP